MRYSERLTDVGAIASIGAVGDSYDNAVAETVVGLYKTECVKIDGPFCTADELELAPCPGCTGSTRTGCTHRSITSTPVEKEDVYYRENNPQCQPALGELALH